MSFDTLRLLLLVVLGWQLAVSLVGGGMLLGW